MKEERKVSLLPVSVEWYVNLTGNVWTSPLPPPPPHTNHPLPPVCGLVGDDGPEWSKQADID